MIGYLGEDNQKNNQESDTGTNSTQLHGSEESEEEIITNAVIAQFASLGCDERSDLYVKDGCNSDKAIKKMRTGLKSFGSYLDEDDVLVYFDSTLFGGGDEGFIFAKDGIFFKQSFSDPDHEMYDSIESVSSGFGCFKIKTFIGKIDISCAPNEVRDAAISAINSVKFMTSK